MSNLEFNEIDGRFYRDGELAGYLHPNGYRYIRFRGKSVREHRLAWYFIRGEWPELDIDHINGDRSDNRPENLRVATRGQNAINRPVRSDSLTGVKGVSFRRGLYEARIVYNNKRIHIGAYKTLQEARKAYNDKAIELFGDFVHDSVMCGHGNDDPQ